MSYPRAFDLNYGETFSTQHSTRENWAIAQQGLILLSEIGSTMHGVSSDDTGDDLDLMGICIEPPSESLGLGDFEQYEYRDRKVNERSQEGDTDLVVYCHTPESRVLTADLRWRRIDSLSVGDRVISFDEGPNTPQRHRHFSTGTVTAVERRMAEVVEVQTSEGATRVTPDHPFLVRKDNGFKNADGRKVRSAWVRAGDLREGDKIYSLPTWDEDLSHGGGYLAGQYDGEGSLSLIRSGGFETSTLPWAQNPGPEVARVEQLLVERGFKTRTHGHNKCLHVHVAGDWTEQMRLLGSVRPYRLLRHPRIERLWEGRSLQACGRATVKSVTTLGVREIVAMETDTHTYIADGLLGHNSLRKWTKLAATGNPTVIMLLFSDDELHVKQINGFGMLLRRDFPKFLSRQAGHRFLGYLDGQLQRYLDPDRVDSKHATRPELIEKYGYDTKLSYHALRLAIQGKQLMDHHRIDLPMLDGDREFLLDVRHGHYTREWCIEETYRRIELLKASITQSTLPERANRDVISKWMSNLQRAWWEEIGL